MTLRPGWSLNSECVSTYASGQGGWRRPQRVVGRHRVALLKASQQMPRPYPSQTYPRGPLGSARTCCSQDGTMTMLWPMTRPPPHLPRYHSVLHPPLASWSAQRTLRKTLREDYGVALTLLRIHRCLIHLIPLIGPSSIASRSPLSLYDSLRGKRSWSLPSKEVQGSCSTAARHQSAAEHVHLIHAFGLPTHLLLLCHLPLRSPLLSPHVPTCPIWKAWQRAPTYSCRAELDPL